jgi:hypothetical protein
MRLEESVMSNEETYDAFLSHSRLDADVVEELARRLEDKEELRVWLDKWVLVPGENWIPAMARGLEEARSCVVCVGKNTPRGWYHQEIQLALRRQLAEPSFRVIPLLLPNALEENVDDFLGLRTWVDMRQGIDDPLAFHRLVRGIQGLPPDRGPGEPGHRARPAEDASILSSGEALRGLELTYLDDLLLRYEYWRDHYTPLAGIAEVRAAVRDGPRLDLPMPFIPQEFEKLVEHGFGEQVQAKREQVDDLRIAIAEHKRITLLGDAGSGKTTTLWRLAYDYAQAAKDDAKARLPVWVPLGSYTDDTPFDDYLASHLGSLSPHVSTYRASGRLILLLDGLNEMPQTDYAARVGRIQSSLDRYPHEIVVVTCRALDYVARLEGLQRIEVLPLDNDRIRTFLHNYLGEAAGERLFWTLCGGDELQGVWNAWKEAGGTWEEFWTAENMPYDMRYMITTASRMRMLWTILRQKTPPLLALGRNPYILLMTAQVYAAAGGELPANRGQMLAAFVDVLLERERGRATTDWIDAAVQQDVLAVLAYAMQAEKGRGTAVSRDWAVEHLGKAVPGCDAQRLLHLATSATLLDTGNATVRFYHQLLQEYFAARELGRHLAAGESPDWYWPMGRWWKPSGWEETFILLAGIEQDASLLLTRLNEFHPVIAARCLLEVDRRAADPIRDRIVQTLIATLGDDKLPPRARAQAGDALACLGDPRPGVGLRSDGLPDIAWCEVPAGPFCVDYDTPRQINVPTFSIARYPITNAQYAAFVKDGGYTEQWCHCWTEEGWNWKRRGAVSRADGTWFEESEGVVGDRQHRHDRSSDLHTGAKMYGGVYDLPNHPAVGVNRFEGTAFCCWLTTRLREVGAIDKTQEIVLPSRAQWEKAARGMDGRIYPWGNEPDPNRANYRETGIGATCAVGCFLNGASPYGCLDMAGQVGELTDSVDAVLEDNEDDDWWGIYVYGGGYDSGLEYIRCARPFHASHYISGPGEGFRVCLVQAEN